MGFILEYYRLWKSLNGPTHAAVLLATLISPLAFDLIPGLNDFRWCWHWTCVEWARVFFHVGMWLITIAVIAWARNFDKSGAEEELARLSSSLNGNIDQLRRDHDREISGNRHSIEALLDGLNVLREAIEKQSDMKLPRLPVRIRASASSGAPVMSSRIRTGPPEGWMARLRYFRNLLWLRFRCWFRKWILGKGL